MSVPRQIARFSSPIAREACHEFVSGIGTQGDYRAVYFIEVVGGRKRRLGMRRQDACVPKCKFGVAIRYRLRDQRTTWIRVSAQVCVQKCERRKYSSLPVSTLFYPVFICTSADLKAKIRKERIVMI